MRWEEWPPIKFFFLSLSFPTSAIYARKEGFPAATLQRCKYSNVANSLPRAWRHRARASSPALSIASRDLDKYPRRLLFVLSDIQDRKTIMFVQFSRQWPFYCTYVYACVCVWICRYMCVCFYARVYVYVCGCVGVCVLHVSVRVCVCECVYTFSYPRRCQTIHIASRGKNKQSYLSVWMSASWDLPTFPPPYPPTPALLHDPPLTLATALFPCTWNNPRQEAHPPITLLPLQTEPRVWESRRPSKHAVA